MIHLLILSAAETASEASGFGLDAIRFGYQVLADVGWLIVAVYTWWVNREKVNKATIDGLSARIDEVDKEILLLKTDMRHLPSREDMRRLWNKIDHMNHQLGEMHGQLTNTRRAVETINEYLLNRSGS